MRHKTKTALKRGHEHTLLADPYWKQKCGLVRLKILLLPLIVCHAYVSPTSVCIIN